MTPNTLAALAGEWPAVVERLWPPAPRSVGRARRFLVRSLDAWGLPHLAESAELVVSELTATRTTLVSWRWEAAGSPGRQAGT
jgi:hypothetical protein